jgi:predicted CXXCH cytochrome family protein
MRGGGCCVALLKNMEITKALGDKCMAITLAGVITLSVLLVACTGVQRTIVAPPRIAGAEFVGSQECAQCHANITRTFHDATHARLNASAAHAKETGCETCHGPGSLHVKSGGGAGTIINPKHSPEACFQCHLDKRGEAQLPHAHPVLAGKMSCADCHDPHSGDAVIGKGTQLASVNDVCLKCHTAQRGPFVFEHEALREGCVTCHNPHGSVNEKMLIARNQALCLRCHFQQQTGPGQLLIGGVNHLPFITRGTCWSAGCHEAIHGSHVNSSLRY